MLYHEAIDRQRKIFDQAKIPEVLLQDEGDRTIITTALELTKRGDDPRHSQLAEQVLEIYRQPPETATPNFDKYIGSVDQGMTAEFAALFAWDNPSSFLAEHRRKLGYEQSSAEIPFNAVVIKPPSYPTDEDVGSWKFNSYSKKTKAWLDFSGCEGYFMMRDRLYNTHPSTIFVPPFAADDLLRPDPKNPGDSRSFIHEYYHTQRHFTYADDGLYHWLDEIGVDWEPRTGYGPETCALALLSRTTPDITLSEDLATPFFADDARGKAQLLRKIKSNFGAAGLLLLGVAPIRGIYQVDFDLPLSTVAGPMNESTRLLETMLELRQQVDPTWLQTFERRLRTVSLFNLEGQRGYALGPYKKIDPSSGEKTLVGQVMAIWEQVCQDKARAGEVSFYDKPKK